MVNSIDLPTFITALATLVAAVTALVKVFQVQRSQSETHETIKAIDVHTNGAISALRQSVIDMRSQQATPAEIAARVTDPPELPPAA